MIVLAYAKNHTDMTPEEIEHKQFCQYIKLQYPHLLFNTDLSGVRLPIGLAKKLKNLRSDRAWPDIFIAEPRGQYHGLYIEMKKDGLQLLTKDGKLKKQTKSIYKNIGGQRVKIGESDHISEQYNMLIALKNKGYKAVFCPGCEIAIKVLNEYLNLPENYTINMQ